MVLNCYHITCGKKRDEKGTLLVFKSIAGQVDLKSVPTASPPLLDLSEFFEPIIKEAEAQIRFQAPVGGNHQKISEYMTKICKNEKVLSTDVYQK